MGIIAKSFLFQKMRGSPVRTGTAMKATGDQGLVVRDWKFQKMHGFRVQTGTVTTVFVGLGINVKN